MKTCIPFATLAAMLLAFPLTEARAQMAGSPSTGINATFAKLFGEHKAFSASADLKVEGQQPMALPLELALLDNKMRTEVDMTKFQSADVEGGADMMKSMGMDRIISISLLNEKSTRLILPGLKAMVDVPMPEEEAASLEGEAKVDTTVLGKETINGHPCSKNKMVITDSKGKQREATVWNATDLKNFPVQIQMTDKGSLTTLKFKDVKFVKPDAKLFATPEGYTKYAGLPELMAAVMGRMMGGAEGK